MNTDILQGKWEQLKGAVKTQWGKLTDDHLDQIDGQYDKLVGQLREAYGYNKAEAKREIDRFFEQQSQAL